MASLLTSARLLLFVILSLSWVFLFLIPGIKRFEEKNTTFEEWTEDASSLPPPSITLCPFEKAYQGWKNVTKPIFRNTYQQRCAGANSSEEFLECYEQKTFNLTETFPNGAGQGMGSMYREVLMDPDLWLPDMTKASNGRCFTLNYTESLRADVEAGSLIFNFDPKIKYMIFIHQLDFFVFNLNPLAIPRIWLTLDFQQTGLAYHYLYLEPVRQEKMNRPEQPCNPVLDYRFNDCIKEKASRKVGCRLPWDKLTKGMYSIGLDLSVISYQMSKNNLHIFNCKNTFYYPPFVKVHEQ